MGRRTLLLAALALLLAAPAADASFPGRNGKIVQGWQQVADADDGAGPYSQVVEGLRTFEPGSDMPRLLLGCEALRREDPPCPGPAYGWPSVSADGRLLAFTAAGRIGFVAIDGSGLRFLPSARRALGLPALSPDGRQVAFVTHRSEHIWIADVDSGRARHLTRGTRPDWSVRNRIAFVRDGQVLHVRPDGTDERRVARAGDWPSWSPDGTRLAYTRSANRYSRVRLERSGGVFSVGLNGDRLRRIARAGGVLGFSFGPVEWSPDGRRMLIDGHLTLYEVAVRSRRVLRDLGPTEQISAGSSRTGSGVAWQPLPQAGR